MDDTISRAAAIDAMEQAKERYFDRRVIIGKMQDIVSNLPSQQEQQWIPLSERTPDMDERVLVYTVAHEYHIWDCMSNRGESYFWEDEEGLYHNKYEVDLWMSIPDIQER